MDFAFISIKESNAVGTQYKFKCMRCGYETIVAGERSIGMFAVIQTMTCNDCRELVDVLIGFFGDDGPSGNPENDEMLNTCPECNGKKVTVWPKSKPCPRCKGVMESCIFC